jgi:hypothetical protein
MTLHEIHREPFFAQFLEANDHFITLISTTWPFRGSPDAVSPTMHLPTGYAPVPDA